ncbi:LuxR C-terminal-related transcriptional regulator [Streptacidiphilus sp. PAMC 29251]
MRTAPILPQRLVILDRTSALVPIDPSEGRNGALHVTEPGIVAALVTLFEQAWSTAVPLGAARSQDPETGLTDTERELLRLLGGGLTDDTAGQRLGLSTRTVRRHMASVMERLNASSRFEAGIKAAAGLAVARSSAAGAAVVNLLSVLRSTDRTRPGAGCRAVTCRTLRRVASE